MTFFFILFFFGIRRSTENGKREMATKRGVSEVVIFRSLRVLLEQPFSILCPVDFCELKSVSLFNFFFFSFLVFVDCSRLVNPSC